ncbi:hypothetical protein [Halomonas sp. MMSF_3323]|uniref:hypothetical protein n=1 Tax=Halomonas sp. MMSF_3323 TaxID=3046701 RepID=UPI002740032F|nr:hypothetical protein [Halomonas sp. MMSF_3323]
MKQLLTALALMGLSTASFAEALEQYDSVTEMIHARGDFDESNHSFEMLSDDPVAFRLSKPSFASDSDEVVYYENWRAAIYGVYNTFAHTSLNSVTVTAEPLQYESFQNMENFKFLEDKAVTLSLTREEALEALQSLIDVDSFDDIKTKTSYGYSWSPEFENVYYEDRDPGIDSFTSSMLGFCTGFCR